MVKTIAFLEQLQKNGLTQAQIAAAVGLSPQFLSDVMKGRRPLTELVARRIGERFHVDYRRVLGDKAPRMIALTGYGQQGDREKSREAGFDMHLIKPIEVPKLLAAIDG